MKSALITALALAMSLGMSGHGQAAPAGGGAKGGSMVLATIIQSGSTNARGYTVAIHDDGSATAVFSGEARPGSTPEPSSAGAQRFPPGTVDAKRLQTLLDKVGDVSRIPTGFCPKSVSFGTRTRISYGGKTSSDLQCVHSAADADDSARELAKFVQETLGQLHINTLKRRP
jgi:hypothetical protein